jgi:RHS repeat-associated protein
VLGTWKYHYDGSHVAVEYQPFAIPLTPFGPPASGTWTYYGGLMRTDGTNQEWYYRDGLGSVSAVTDNSGNVIGQYEYNAQGQFKVYNGSGTVQSSTQIGNYLLYAGYYYDTKTANYFCNARYYNPVLGRFISRDPLSGRTRPA